MAGGERCELAYEDHTILGRKIYRDFASGRKVDADQVDAVIEVESPPLSEYFRFGSRKE